MIPANPYAMGFSWGSVPKDLFVLVAIDRIEMPLDGMAGQDARSQRSR
jgi:hypothetical protein